MKKMFIVMIAGLGLVSCKKDWTCQCTAGSITNSSTIYNSSLEDATAECNDEGTVMGVDYECKVNVFK